MNVLVMATMVIVMTAAYLAQSKLLPAPVKFLPELMSAVLAAAPALGLRCEIRTLAPAELAAADELFVTNSIIGIRSLARVRGHADWVFTARDCAEQLAAHLRGQGVVA